jgi:peptidoglycan/LPS O-acetylase OafA/YrhL
VLSLALALLVFAGAQPHGLLGRRAVPGAAWFAAISFSLYLVHKPIYGVVQAHWGDWLEGRGIVAYAAYGAASLLGAAVLYFAVERPGLRLRARLLSRRESRRTAAVNP